MTFAHGLVKRDAGAAQDRDELWMGTEPDAAAGQIFCVALEYRGMPADAAKQIGCQ